MQRVCVAAVHYDIEAWVTCTGVSWRDDWFARYDAIAAVHAAAAEYEPHPCIVEECWPQVLDDYRRAGLVA